MGTPNIGLALGGGAARGLAHIAIMESMDDLGVKPHVIAGTSIGAYIGSGYAAGLTGLQIREHALATLGSTRAIMARLWRLRARNFGDLVTSFTSMQMESENVLRAFMPDEVPETFEELKIPLHVTSTDYYAWQEILYSSGALLPALAASIAIPNVFKPVIFRDRLMIDGGAVNPLPMNHATHETDILIAVDVNGAPQPSHHLDIPTSVELNMTAAQILMNSVIAHKLAVHRPQIYVKPKLDDLGAFDFHKARYILKMGDKEKDEFKRKLTMAIEHYHHQEALDA